MAHSNRRDLTRQQVAKVLDDFLDGTGGKWDWDDFTSVPLADPELEAIRVKGMLLPAEFPPTTRTEYSNEQGRQVLRNLANQLKVL